MPTNNQSPWLPANHRKPSRAELQAQYTREEEASALGKIKAQRKLQEQIKGMDYSRSQAGSTILNKALEIASAAIDDGFENTTKRAGNGCAVIAPVYKQMKHTPLINLPKFRDGEVVLDDNGEQVPAFTTERHTCLWDSDDIAFITLLTMLDVVRMPLLGTIDNQSKQGRRYGTRPDVYGLHALIAGRLNDHLCHTFIRRCTRGTGKDQMLDFILADAYDNKAGAKQKQVTTRLARKEQAEEFIAKDLGPVAEVLQWKPWGSKVGHAVAAKAVSLVNYGCEVALGFRVFETVNRFDSQFYSLTEEAQEWADQLDQARIGKSFSTDVMVCQPRPHTPNRPGGYIGAAASLIKATASGGFKGEFLPSHKHLRLVNATQNVSYRINSQILEVMEALHQQPHQDWREVDHFIPTPSREHYLKTPELGPKPEGMTPEQKAKRDEQRNHRKKEFAKYRKKQASPKAPSPRRPLIWLDVARTCRPSGSHTPVTSVVGPTARTTCSTHKECPINGHSCSSARVFRLMVGRSTS